MTTKNIIGSLLLYATLNSLMASIVLSADSGENGEWDIAEGDDFPRVEVGDGQFNMQQQGQFVQYANPTEDERQKQHDQIIQFYRENVKVDLQSSFAFQITQQYEQFHFHLPTDKQIFFMSRVYILKDNVYSQIKKIQDHPAIHLVVYQNNHRIITEKTFYFNAVIKINGKAGSTYMIRYFSSSHKLVMVTHNNFVQSSHFQQKLQSSLLEQHQIRISQINNYMSQAFKRLRTTYHVQFTQRYNMTKKVEQFSTFEIIQMFLVMALCLFQIKMVSKLFKTDSII